MTVGPEKRWATGDEAGDTEMVTGTPCAGNLVDSRLKELLPALPVVYVKAVPVQVCPSRYIFEGNAYSLQ